VNEDAPPALATPGHDATADTNGAPDVDVRGVDRVQIRRMLALSPLERLRWLEEFVNDIVNLRRMNEEHAVR